VDTSVLLEMMEEKEPVFHSAWICQKNGYLIPDPMVCHHFPIKKSQAQQQFSGLSATYFWVHDLNEMLQPNTR